MLMHVPSFFHLMHHIPPVPPSISSQSTQRPRGKVMQEPLFGAFLHHFSTTSRQAARIRGARTRSIACTQVHERIESGRTASGPRSDEKSCTKGRGAPSCSSSSHHNSKGERIDDECFLCPFSSSILILSEITDYFFFR